LWKQAQALGLKAPSGESARMIRRDRNRR
jgi:hypothetical protein